MIKRSELTKDVYSTGELSKMLGVTRGTIMNWIKSGKIQSNILPSGHHRITKENFIGYLEHEGLFFDDMDDFKHDVIYARVSTHKQRERGDLDRQVDKVKLFAIEYNPKNLKVITDVASGLNDNRRGLNQLLDLIMDGRVNRVFVLYKDRLTRFGYNYLSKVCEQFDVELIIVSSEVENKSLEMELAEDIISIIHSFSGKLYGMRSKVLKTVEEELGDESS